MIDHRSFAHNLSSSEIKAWKKNSGLNGIRAHDLCDTGAVLYQLSYQANGALETLWIRNMTVEGEEYKWIYEVSYIKLRGMIWRYDLSSKLCTQLKQSWN